MVNFGNEGALKSKNERKQIVFRIEKDIKKSVSQSDCLVFGTLTSFSARPNDQAVTVPLAGAREGADTRAYSIKSSQPLPDSKVHEFSQWVVAEDWGALKGNLSTSDQATKLREILNNQIDKHFPVMQCRVSNGDKA